MSLLALPPNLEIRSPECGDLSPHLFVTERPLVVSVVVSMMEVRLYTLYAGDMSTTPQNETPIEFGQLMLCPGARYRVIKDFGDFDSMSHHIGEEWSFVGYDFSPYDAGWTLVVHRDGDDVDVVRMQDQPESQGPILEQFERFVERID